jgi:hypothetical protein
MVLREAQFAENTVPKRWLGVRSEFKNPAPVMILGFIAIVGLIVGVAMLVTFLRKPSSGPLVERR